MRSHSRWTFLIYVVALALLGILCGLLPQFTTSPNVVVNARNVPSTQLDSEPLQDEPSRHIQNLRPPLDVKDVQQVRDVFHVIDYDERQEKKCHYLIRIGAKAFPAYEAILSDPKSDSMELSGVLWALWYGKADPRRFLKYAVPLLLDADFVVRLDALRLLERIGRPEEASPVVALLSDKKYEVAYAAAKTLAAIGSPKEVVAMDVWLQGVSYREDRELRQRVKQCRDALQKRLDKARESTK